eukprot:TRINITY_DN514_c0_g1_i1.p1 TRINITY_DN514_c0_g1~~TRINITY_DN514_c0_g1_i1.p1  ORF type:complete len:190 (+),score=61.18 TRINITY_DN514_c0_g1_i1:75-644(+)
MMSIRSPLARAARFASSGVVRRDLFGYEQSTEVGPWNKKISEVKYWNDAGEYMVDMNRDNCPPDLSTYTEVLRAILRCDSKLEGGVTEGESKFCAMMDVLEEMSHRNNIDPDMECWKIVAEECVASGDFRAGRALAACVAEYGDKTGIPQNLIDAIEKKADEAKAAGKEFPAALQKQSSGLFDMEIKAQ